ncbi:hypothetical protein PV327_003170 [Microctonus hyperodae]|uniref:C2H2-type domain-containing protein n=2 Tax=Microctonus hyperodae TaxID=165561 RepID=A0AA39G3Z0_MICHY|nr:hypothetical protein PV327_003170 [Microctonus hyperodae]
MQKFTHTQQKAMSMEDEDVSENQIQQHKDFALLHELNETSGDMLECLSVMVDDAESENNEVQGIIVDAPLLGATLTAITLPDGTQAFVTNNIDESDDGECKNEELDSYENTRTLLISNLSEGSDSKTIQFELKSPTVVKLKDELSTKTSDNNTYSHVEFIDGTTYMVTNSAGLEDEIWEINDGKVKKKETNIMYNKLPNTKLQYPCPREGCTKLYSTPHHLKVHERSHTGQKPYGCTHAKCEKSFSTGYSLKAHLRTHTGEKPYKCTAEPCNKSFKTSGDLLKHMRTHTGERPFVCPFEECGRSFTTSNIRKVHVRTHTGERPYQCSRCPKAFASATNYKNHVRIHSGEKPYACSTENCDKRFTEYSSLYKHYLVHTQEKPFECTICLKRYRQSSTLVMHKRTAHALVESDNGMDIFLQDASISSRSKKKFKNTTKQNKLSINNDGVLEISEATEDSIDNETQILLVSDPTQLASLQHMNLDSGFDDSTINTSLEELNIKIEDMELGWN